MAIVTLLSDFGTDDHYVAAVRAKILHTGPSLTIVDISHHIRPCDVAHGSFVLKAVFRDFPKGTVHLVAVNTVPRDRCAFVAIALEGHYFVGPDNGFFGLISEQEATEVVILEGHGASTFPAKDIMATAAAKLAIGESISSLGGAIEGFKKMLGMHLRATKKQISGHVVRVDHYGNLITNIDKQTFDFLSEGKQYIISFGRERANRVNENYSSVDAGDCFVVFNTLGLLEIGINQGHASELLGLEYDSPVRIDFNE